MDRNLSALAVWPGLLVALRKESVDRNKTQMCELLNQCKVALRKESVDRNVQMSSCTIGLPVALRKESVDRNSPISRGFSGG